MNDWSTLKKLIWLYHISGGGSSGTITTVTGTSPLALVNALAKPIKKLIQYGKVTTVDGEMFCNNGKLVAVDDELPSGYKRLLGITFDGNFHYKTGEAMMGSDDVTMTLNNLSSSGRNVFGSYNGQNDKNFSLYVYGSASTGSYFRYGNQLKRPKYGGTGRRTITFGASGTSGFAEDSDVTPDEFTTPANTYIGMLPNSSSSAYTGDIVGSITVSNRLEWIPTERELDGVIGYYEKFNGNFIAPTGSGTPVSLGYDTSHLALGVVGTPEVLTAGGNLLSRDGETVGENITYNGVVSNNANYSISAPFVLPAGNYTCTWQVGSGTRPFSVFAVDESGTPQPDGKLFYQQSATEGINTGEFAVEAETLVVASYRRNATDLAIYSHAQTATVANLFAAGDVKDEQDIISGVVTRRTEVSVVGGVVTVSALAEPVMERVTAQPMRTAEGTNTVSVVSDVAPVELSVEYMASA